MFRDILEILKDFFHRVIRSRVFVLAVIFTGMFASLAAKLFDLQIIHGEEYLTEYVLKTLRTVYTPGARGNIYDKNGKVLAYNELAYAVTVQDTGVYSTQEMNRMLLRLVRILDSHGEPVKNNLDIALNVNGELAYTSSSEAARKRFLRDFYGLTSVNKLDDEKGKYPSSITAAEVLETLRTRYKLDQLIDEKGNPVLLTDQESLDICSIRYAMAQTAYTRYEAVTVASGVSQKTVVEIAENKADLTGVNIEESTVRVYNDSIYFAPIIGYTGKVQSTEQLEELQEVNKDYQLNDVVGRTGIENSLEYELQGKKGVTNMYVDSRGQVLQVEDNSTEPQAGNDVYLTIDSDLQIGIYNLLEQQLAGVLIGHLVNRDVTEEENRDSSKKKIPIKDAYFQLINNNVLSLKAMEEEEAEPIERQIYERFVRSRKEILEKIRAQLMDPNAPPMAELPEDMRSYMLYIHSYLSSDAIGIIKRSEIGSDSKAATGWKDETISLRDYLYMGISESWVDTAKLPVENKYSDADDSFQAIVEYVLDALSDDMKFSKRIFRYLINQDIITGRDLCLALFAQEVLPYDEEAVAKLTNGGGDAAFQFMIDKISTREITPAQLALDPCTAGCTVVNVKTGEVLALVTYPSYDNNRSTVDAAYFSQLNEDLSLPLYNNATQVRKAPGSTFKPIAAIAGLEEGVISTTEEIECSGIYQEVSNPIRCWIYPGRHGKLNVEGALENSCNTFFNEVGHRLSTDENGVYSTERGLEAIQKYASMFGLDRTTGIEISENNPELSNTDPERSAMGQGTNNYTNIQLARYVTALATRGNVYELSLVDKVTDSAGTVIQDKQPVLSSHVEIADTTWNAVQNGMRAVITNTKVFKDLEVDIAGKTGTAQESTRANHGLFISYGPYQNPEISVTVNIPYGYTSANAAAVAKSVYRLYYGYTDLDYILNTGAVKATDVVIGD